MNKQIQDLMAQAGFDPSAIQRMGIMPQAEKFSELLVELCAKQCNPEPGLKYSPNSLSARIDCKNKILELL